MATPYQSGLGDLSESSALTPDFSASYPAYLKAADYHNIGNSGGGSWFDPTTWPDKIGENVSGAGKFIAVSALSGADSIYNSALTVTNWFGNDAKIVDTQQWITSLDQDLGQYYSENRQSADLAGFIATSLIPGIGGIKILNAGQAALKSAASAGKLGANMSRVTGIVAPNIDNYVALAGAEIKSAQAVFTTLNTSTLKALGAGVQQNILEGVAFETFVQATMFKSPILEQQDNWDIAKNIALGGALGGVIGGALQGAGIYSKVKLARQAEDLRLKPFTSRELLQPATRPSDKIILGAENRELTPKASAPELPANPTATDLSLYNAQLANAEAAIKNKSKQIDLDARKAMHEMNDGAPVELINAVADTQTNLATSTAISNWSNALNISRANVVTKLESKFAADLDGAAGAIPVASRWIKIAGEEAGQISHELPPILNLADRVKVTKDGAIADSVRAVVKDYKFTTTKLYDPLADSAKGAWKEAEARFIWADNLSDKALGSNQLISANDLPLLQRYMKSDNLDFRIKLADGTESKFTSPIDLRNHIIERKLAIANDIVLQRLPGINLPANPIETTMAAIAKTVDVSPKYLEGIRDALDETKGLFANSENTIAFHNDAVARGLANANDVPTPAYFKPTIAKITYDARNNIDSDGHIIDALTAIKANQKEFKESANRVFTKQAGGEIAGRLEDINLDNLIRANSSGAGAGFLSFARAAYGSLEATVQKLGGVSKDLQIAGRKEVDDKIQAALYNLSQSQESVIEWNRVNQLLSKTSEDYVFDTLDVLGQGTDTLIPKKVMQALSNPKNELEAADIALQPGAPEYIKFQNWQTAAAFQAHTDLNGVKQINRQERNAAQGHLDGRDPNIVRSVNPSPKDFKHFAFVTDPRVTGAGHKTMLFANTEKELEALIAKTNRDFPEFEVLTKQDTKDWFDAHKGYLYERGLNENYIDSSLKRKGIYSNFYTQTDVNKTVNDILQYHYRAADGEAADLMRLRYADAFDWLENQANSYSKLETSKLEGGKLETIAQNEKNPYISYVKTALNLSSTPTSNPWWSLNKFIDDQGSRFVGRVRQAFDSATSPDQLSELNGLLEKYGSQTAFNSASEVAFINHTAPKAEISKFVRAANSIMSRFTLGLDPLNAIVNAVGANVNRGTELYVLTKAIKNGNSTLAGELAQLGVKIPGVPDYVLSAPKLQANSIRRLSNPETRKVLLEEYKAAGISKTRIEQFYSIQDDFALRGTETVGELESRKLSAFGKAKELAGKAGDRLETLSGNTYAEQFNRFMAVDSIRQITDLGEKAGLLTRAESISYWNVFVNRVEGNIIASQRPGIFQGPVGQAIGLFQSYQFNMIQNIFRHVAEGEKKDLAMLMGLQATFFGIQGTPGFKFLNDHVVGTMSGNPQHRDIYDATRGILGKEAGEWLLYGAASNIMQTNVYSRGDINPRSLTIVPTNIADVPFVGGMAKVFSTLYETAQKIGGGGNVWETIRQGIEHNGVSRPLAGLAQVSRGITGDKVFSTSSKGTILGSNDLVSLATMSRIAGGRPLDEAIQNDTMFSINSYEAVDRLKKNRLAETVKTTVIQGQVADADSINSFAQQYAELGGKQGGFAKYMMENYIKANTTQAAIMAQKLNNPLSYKIQALMTPDGNSGF